MRKKHPWSKPEWINDLQPGDKDHTVIAVDFGMQNHIAHSWGISKSAVSHYLRGLYTEDNPRLDLVHQVRAYARRIVEANGFYLVRDNFDNRLRVFDSVPRRDSIEGYWFDPRERVEGNEHLRPAMPEEMFPWAEDLTFEASPVKFQIKRIN